MKIEIAGKQYILEEAEVTNCSYKGRYWFCYQIPDYVYVDFDTLMCKSEIIYSDEPYTEIWRYFPEYIVLLEYTNNKNNLDKQYFFKKRKVSDKEIQKIADAFLKLTTSADILQWWLYNWNKFIDRPHEVSCISSSMYERFKKIVSE